MALAISFTPVGMTAQRYDEVTRKLEAAGQGAPRGRLHHVCYGDESNLRVMDVWDSQESFEAFGQTLMPLLQEQGIELGQPDVAPVHNIVKG